MEVRRGWGGNWDDADLLANSNWDKWLYDNITCENTVVDHSVGVRCGVKEMRILNVEIDNVVSTRQLRLIEIWPEPAHSKRHQVLRDMWGGSTARSDSDKGVMGISGLMEKQLMRYVSISAAQSCGAYKIRGNRSRSYAITKSSVCTLDRRSSLNL